MKVGPIGRGQEAGQARGGGRERAQVYFHFILFRLFWFGARFHTYTVHTHAQTCFFFFSSFAHIMFNYLSDTNSNSKLRKLNSSKVFGDCLCCAPEQSLVSTRAILHSYRFYFFQFKLNKLIVCYDRIHLISNRSIRSTKKKENNRRTKRKLPRFILFLSYFFPVILVRTK